MIVAGRMTESYAAVPIYSPPTPLNAVHPLTCKQKAVEAPIWLALFAVLTLLLLSFLYFYGVLKALSAPLANPSVGCWLEGANSTYGYCVSNGTAVFYYTGS